MYHCFHTETPVLRVFIAKELHSRRNIFAYYHNALYYIFFDCSSASRSLEPSNRRDIAA